MIGINPSEQTGFMVEGRTDTDIAACKRTAASLQLLESVFSNINDAVAIAEAKSIEESSLRILYANEAFTRMTGYDPKEVLGNPHLLLGARTEPATLNKIRLALEFYQPVIVELLNYRKSGSEFWVELSIFPVKDENSCYTYWVFIYRELTRKRAEEAQSHVKVAETTRLDLEKEIAERKRAEEALAKSEAKFRSLIQNSSDIIGIFEPDGTIRYESPSIERVLGYKPEELVGKNAVEFIHPEDIQNIYNGFKDLIENLGATRVLECRFQRKDGSWCFLESTGSNLLSESSVKGIVVNSRDITERKVAQEQLLHDALTGLPNRALFMEHLRHAFEYSKRYETYLFAVLFLNLDRFKVINDSLGHTCGDELLNTIAQRLKACLRSTDVAARLGGDDFAILLEGIKDVSDAVRVCERIKQKLAMPLILGGQEVFTTASIGIALSITAHNQPEDLLRNADTAMSRAKLLGNARYEIFNPDMHARAVARLQLETALRRAIENQEFRIHYQPIVALATGRISGFEALVRWQHPQLGLVYPAEFILVAEETGLIIPIDQWVLAQACRQASRWQEQFPHNLPLTISVNLCKHQFTYPELIKHIEQTLQETGLDARSLKLEITERVIMENSESATLRLKQIRALGIELSIDDFGTGYSSLSRLHKFPIGMLKIDRSFVSRIGVNEGNLEIVETIVTLAQKLNMAVTAEGVETKEQLAQLRKLQCEYGQGYFFSQPLDSEAAEALLVANPQW